MHSKEVSKQEKWDLFLYKINANNYRSSSAQFLRSKQAVEVQTSKGLHWAVMNPTNLAERQDRSKKGEERNSQMRMSYGGSPSISGQSHVDAAAWVDEDEGVDGDGGGA